MKNVCCDKVERRLSCGCIEVDCENHICDRKEFIFDTLIYSEPM